MSTGTTVQIIGAVVDVEFPSDAIPHIYDALIIDEVDITLEVQQQLGDGVVRTIAMGSSEGLQRGMPVSNTGHAIRVPVGEKLWAASWMCSANRSTTKAILVPRP